MRIPRKLYKYRSVDPPKITEDIFLKRCLFFSSPTQFNDPFDCRIEKISTQCTIEQFRGAVEKDRMGMRRLLEEYRPPIAETSREAEVQWLFNHKDEYVNPRRLKSILDKANDKMGVLCLSALRDHILMWSHCADCHRGICLEFDTKIGESLFREARDVGYCEELPVFECYNSDVEQTVKKAIFRKAPEWNYEKEWRIICPNMAGKHVSLPNGSLTGVILGVNISKKHEAKVRKWCKKITPHPRVYKAALKKDAYGLDIEKIDT